jgi:hypothetical protein
MFLRSGWSVVRSALLAKGGTLKECHRTSIKFRLGVIGESMNFKNGLHMWYHIYDVAVIMSQVRTCVVRQTSSVN